MTPKQRLLLRTLAILCSGLPGPASAATTAYWPFQDQAPGVLATTVVSAVYGDVLVGQGKSNGTGRRPSHDADVPAPNIYNGLFGALLNASNTASLYFTNAAAYPAQTNSQNGGYVEVTNVTSLLCPTNFTLEFFAKIARDVDWPLLIGKSRDNGGGSWVIDMDRSNPLKLRIDSHPLNQVGNSNGFNENLTGPNIQDGKWHHIAVTYDSPTRRATFYSDYSFFGSRTTTHELVYTNYPLLMGRGAGSNQAFDGWLDEVRLSDTVLPVNQFLRPFSVDSQLYFTFDDAVATPSTATSLVCEAISPTWMTGKAKATTGATIKPEFSGDVPPATTTRITHGYKGNVVNADNRSSLFFVNAGLPANTNSEYGGQISIPGYLQPSNFTVEVFFKVNRHVNNPLLVGKVREGVNPTWSISVAGANDEVRCRFDSYPTNWNLGSHTYGESAAVGYNQGIYTGVPVNDGKWHHAAFTYENATTNVLIYVDHVLKKTDKTINPIVYTDGDILVGAGAGERAFDGWIDEVRITPRLLTPDEFLYTLPRLGTLITLE